MTGDKSACNADVAEALYKLLKISGSIQNLLLGGTNILPKLTRDFFIALGESKTMETLNLDYDSSLQGRQNTTTLVLQMLGQAVAYNHYKNGSLKSISLQRGIWTGQFDTLLNNFYISDHDHEVTYGDSKVAKEMTKGQLEKKLQFGLEKLDLRNCDLNYTGSKLKDI